MRQHGSPWPPLCPSLILAVRALPDTSVINFAGIVEKISTTGWYRVGMIDNLKVIDPYDHSWKDKWCVQAWRRADGRR